MSFFSSSSFLSTACVMLDPESIRYFVQIRPLSFLPREKVFFNLTAKLAMDITAASLNSIPPFYLR